ncbi:hypothetical protein FSARC_4995 [Fusarium sarcochroum]|uniref:Uncharacterized protein n=1 Tax=Fusarium sarcochroum TaxID=1208366 RepID=A0A8H4XA04_9HYPO|nr:hypothetical protein FSARC_4995 [Fusarium sarcochroum]
MSAKSAKMAVYSPAFLKSPTLVRFLPTFQPRRFRSIRLGGTRTSYEAYRVVMRSLYHDLGAMVFKGANDFEVGEIGNLLAKAVAHQSRLQKHNLPQHDPMSIAWVRFRKWNVYRIPVMEEKHLDRSYFPERGFLSKEGLHDLGNSVFEMWKEEFSRNVQKKKDGKLYLEQTINGPRLPHLDVFVATGTDGDYLTLHMEFHTVGTRRFVGSMELKLIQPDSLPEDSVNTRLGLLHQTVAPSSTEREDLIESRLMITLWRLEQRIWNLSEEALSTSGKRPPKRYFLSLPPGVQNPMEPVDSSVDNPAVQKKRQKAYIG